MSFKKHSLALFILGALFLCPNLFGLGEEFDLYDAPQALAMGKAMTADAYGYLANYYNPAGLSKSPRRRAELVVVGIDGLSSGAGYANAFRAQSFGINRLFGVLKENPNKYTFFRYSLVPSIAIRGFGFSFLTSYNYAAKSDGTNIDINSYLDVGPTFGFSRNFAGNLVKIGIAAKAIMRNQLKGNFAHSAIGTTDEAISAMMKEGLGIGADLGLMVTLPYKYLPTFGLVWKDMFNTHFIESSVLNGRSSGKPDPIRQSVNAAFSLHPHLDRGIKATYAIEMRKIARPEIPLRKRLHFGVQLEKMRMLYVWAGVNQLVYPTGGIALRLPGGNLELGTYAEDVGDGDANEGNRRYFFRYTISY